MDVDDVCIYPLGHLGLVGQIGNGSSDHVFVWGGQDNELIGMKGGAHAVFSAKFSAGFKLLEDAFSEGEVFNVITHIRVGFQRQDLAVNAKAFDTVSIAPDKGLHEVVRIGQTDFRQSLVPHFLWEFGKVCGGGSSKFYGLILKNTA